MRLQCELLHRILQICTDYSFSSVTLEVVVLYEHAFLITAFLSRVKGMGTMANSASYCGASLLTMRASAE
ncbi:hypothetical protein P030_03560 [Anaplasma phagocytophilum str. CRT35]|nr:hypothetical protein P030_03560 [Anaplasma phagocytophilum str. CRT35]